MIVLFSFPCHAVNPTFRTFGIFLLFDVGEGAIPITLLCVAVLYLGRELLDGLGKSDQISQLTHIIGGVCGIVFGFLSPTARKRKK